ncbi:SPL family radical SAM protein [Candidatus Contubernalis alkaliaceticus]|uniref:SPL family radical SAM protein n=1 Tax=Candidatus Contubernalis alkaliaceticus TaxID=338645 RepID=UPI001F4BE7D0|nr:radical SAM protein [Candidatus Contubernalis alkalaceticus]UNC92260.1 radical SAM protein [Candidatus Contubernalis alkalaceticus]
MKSSYKEMTVKTALTKLKRKIPYGWDLNIYRGCEHGCTYCFARYTQKYLNSEDFFGEVFVKTNIVEVLERTLSSHKWKGEVINIGGITDSYQPCEEKYRLMPEILKLMIKYKTPVIISSKSDLILRDYHLIDQLSRITYVNIAQSIITLDENLRKAVEPGSSPVENRFNVLKEFKKTRASIGLHMMPILPYLTDSRENLEFIIKKAGDIGVDYMLPGTLYLRGTTKPAFMSFLESNFSEVYPRYKKLYSRGSAGKEYKNSLYKNVNEFRKIYCVPSSYMKPMRERMEE